MPASLVYFGAVLPAGPLQASLVGPLLVFLAGVVLNLLAAIPGACLSGFGDVAWDAVTRSIASIVGFVLVWVLVPSHPRLGVLCAAFALQGALALLLSHLALSRRHRIGSLREVRPRAAVVRGMYRESAPLFASRIGIWLTAESTLLIGGYFMGSERIADYALLRQLVSVGVSVTVAIPNAVSPHTSAAYAAGDHAKVRSMFLATLRYGTIVSVLWTVGVLLWAPSVITLLVGAEHFPGRGVLAALALGTFLELFAGLHASFAWNTGKWPFTPFIIGGGLLNIVLASVGCASFGFAGLAWGTVIAQGTTVQWFQVLYAVRASAMGIGAYLRLLVRPAAAYTAAIVVSAAGVKLAIDRVHPPLFDLGASARIAAAAWLLGGVVATSAIAAVLAWSLALTRDDRSYFKRIARLRR